jgi:hypothetical protein
MKGEIVLLQCLLTREVVGCYTFLAEVYVSIRWILSSMVISMAVYPHRGNARSCSCKFLLYFQSLILSSFSYLWTNLLKKHTRTTKSRAIRMCYLLFFTTYSHFFLVFLFVSFVLVELEFELKALHLLDKHSTAWATFPVLTLIS